MSRAVLPTMIGAGGRRDREPVVDHRRGRPAGPPAYSASKGAVAILTKQMAVDFGRHGVRVNAIAPSFVITSINRAMFDRMRAEGAPWEQLLDRHLIRRLGEPRTSRTRRSSSRPTRRAGSPGSSLPVDGGYTAH